MSWIHSAGHEVAHMLVPNPAPFGTTTQQADPRMQYLRMHTALWVPSAAARRTCTVPATRRLRPWSACSLLVPAAKQVHPHCVDHSESF